jgi:phospholysine phosphohistidine inorganic pyrophosphate phosphatase
VGEAVLYIASVPNRGRPTACIAGLRAWLLTMGDISVLYLLALPRLPRRNCMIRGLLLDLEGVLYESGRTIAGAADAVRELAEAGLKTRYLTNTTTRSRRAIVERLQSMGVFIDPQHLFTPWAAACRLLGRDGIRRLHLAAPSGLCEDFAVFDLVEQDSEAVVMGDLHEGFTWRRLNQLFQMVRSGSRLVALHRNRYCRRESGISLDLGAFVAALEYAADIRADVVGKPARAFFDLALADLGLDADEVVMVGDDIEADIGGAQNAGLRAIQVETGKYTAHDHEHPTIRPDLFIPSAATLPAAIAMIQG